MINHVTHNACKNYMLTYYKNFGKVFEKVILWTDKFSAQYKCRQVILDVTTHSKRYPNTSSTHCFATLYNFKGAWDSAGKIPKETLHKLELKGIRSPTYTECSINSREVLSTEHKESPWHILERDGHANLFKKTPFKADRRIFAMCTDFPGFRKWWASILVL